MRAFCSPCSSCHHHHYYRCCYHRYHQCRRYTRLFLCSRKQDVHCNCYYPLSQSCRFFSTPGPLDFLTSPGGLLALLYGRVGCKDKAIREFFPNESNNDKTEARITNSYNSSHNNSNNHDKTNGKDNDVNNINNTIEHYHNNNNNSSGSKQFSSDNNNATLAKWGIDKSYFSREVIVLAVVIFVLSALWEFVQSKRGVLGQMCRNCCMTTLEVRSSQMEYTMIMDWMGRQERGERLRNIALRPNSIIDEEDEANDNMQYGRENEHRQLRTTFVPGYGSHFFMFGKTCMWIVRSEDASKQHGMRDTRVDRENDVLHISFLTRDRNVVKLFLEEVHKSWVTHVQRNVRIYMGSAYGVRWRLIAERMARPLSTLYLPQHIMSLVDEIGVFLSLRETYHALGIPWRRGYLFHGAPGTGKTSFALAIAGALHLSVYVLPLHTHDMDDETLLTIVSTLPPRSLLLIEDIENAIKLTDSHYYNNNTNIFNGATYGANIKESESGLAATAEEEVTSTMSNTCKENDEGSISSQIKNNTVNNDNNKISLSALLNALDGVTCSEGRVLIITTNDVSRIPAAHALLRPGRVDRTIHFDKLQPAELKRMHSLFVDNLMSNNHVPECIRVNLQKPSLLSEQHYTNEEHSLQTLTTDTTSNNSISTNDVHNVEEQSPAFFQQELLNTVYRIMKSNAHTAQELKSDDVANYERVLLY